MSDNQGSFWPVAQSILMAAVLAACVTVTCSNSRLEQRVIDLEKSLRSGAIAVAPSAPAPATAPATAASAASAGSSAATAQPPAFRAFGTGQFAVGWGGKRAEILAVEGAAPGAPVTLAQKPRPQNDHYVTRRGSAPRTLNYYVTSEGETTTITQYILGRLLQPDWDQPERPMPMLATSWDVSSDNLTYTFHLRRGVQFADGRPFTSADLMFSFQVMRDPEVRADNLRGAFEDVADVSAPDAHTFVVTYSRRYWAGIYAFGNGLRVLNKGWYEENIPRYAAAQGVEKFSVEPGRPGFGEVFNNIRVPCPGTGPYYLATDDDARKDSIELVQNPFYWGTQVRPQEYNFSKLRWTFISDEVAAFEAFRKGEFDITVVDADRWEDQLSKDATIEAIAKHERYDHMALDCSYIAWNCRRPPFDDARVRTAMTHLTDREWILREIERGRGTVAVCRSKRNYSTYSNDLAAHPFDVAKARELLEQAGWRDSDGDGVLDRDGRRFEVELKVPSGRTFFTRVGGQIADACRQAGIRLAVRPLEWATFIEDLNKQQFDAVMLYNSWSSPWIDLFESYHSSQDKPDGGNTTGWKSAEVDDLLQAMREEFDDAKRTEMFHRFNRLYYDAQPETLLIHGMVDVLQNRRFEDVRVRPTGLPLHDFWVRPERVLHR